MKSLVFSLNIYLSKFLWWIMTNVKIASITFNLEIQSTSMKYILYCTKILCHSIISSIYLHIYDNPRQFNATQIQNCLKQFFNLIFIPLPLLLYFHSNFLTQTNCVKNWCRLVYFFSNEFTLQNEENLNRLPTITIKLMRFIIQCYEKLTNLTKH